MGEMIVFFGEHKQWMKVIADFMVEEYETHLRTKEKKVHSKKKWKQNCQNLKKRCAEHSAAKEQKWI